MTVKHTGEVIYIYMLIIAHRFVTSQAQDFLRMFAGKQSSLSVYLNMLTWHSEVSEAEGKSAQQLISNNGDRGA